MRRPQRSRSRDRGILQSVAPAPRPAATGAGGVPDWLADLFPGGGGASNTPALPQGIAKPLEIPQALVPGLTVNNEALIKQIAANTGAVITLRQDTRNFGYSLALFAGAPQATFKAKEQLEQHLGLSKKGPITKTVDLPSQNSTAIAALRQIVPAISAKHGMMPIKLISSGMVFQAQIGPGQLAHVVTAESTLRRQLRDIELDIYSRSGRKVPAEIKYAMMCKSTMEGVTCPNNISCQFCHTEQELQIASKCLWENVTKPSELKGGDAPVAMSLTPTSIKDLGNPADSVDLPRKSEAPKVDSGGSTSGLL
eukprot:TRINITY_DN7557_c0_g2_i1.p1 TRINITY_DN7557_c0_g2~~TRINITY_DN7557_c0_g2_i1.p1  ORF type:complete len:326 (+),score=60.83 TRINITY_DN7557_c0_g2_i1:50-979(+)